MRRRIAGVLALGVLAAIALAVHAWGLRRDLPYTPETDEPFLVEPALRIAWSGDWNPRWFGYPGSTVIYPLALGYRVAHVVRDGGSFRGESPMLRLRILATPGAYYLPARWLSVGYAVVAIVLVAVIGTMAAGSLVGAASALFALACPLAIDMARQVRSDSAATCFGLLCLALLFRLRDRPTLARQLLAGATAGLAIASRYVMAVLVPILLAVDVELAWRRGPHRWGDMLAGLVAVPLVFCAVTPYLLLDLPTARASLAQAAAWQHGGHLGADGRGPFGNLWWYLTDALPHAATPAHALLAVVGLVVVLRGRESRLLLLVGYAALSLAGMSLATVHWARWTIPILPVLWILAAVGLRTVVERLRPVLGARAVAIVFAGAVAALSFAPATRVVAMSQLHAVPSTRIVAREWLLANVPPETRLAQEFYTAPLQGTHFVPEELFALSQQPLAYYRKRRFRYLLVSSAVYERFEAEPERYAEQVAFYRDLAAQATLRQEFTPSATRGGPVIRVYELPE